MKAIDKIKDKLNNMQPLSNRGAVWVVVAIHLLVLGSLCSASPKKSTLPNPKPTPKEMDKTFLDTPEGKYVGIPDPKPTPEPLKKEILPDGKTATYPIAKETKPNNNSKYTQTYIVKKGDTIQSIAKKYHLVTKRLIEINHIKDSNNIKEGQVLKFF